MKELNRWYRRRRFIKAYKIMRNESEKHIAAGHYMRFEAVNEAYMIMVCIDCPDLLP